MLHGARRTDAANACMRRHAVMHFHMHMMRSQDSRKCVARCNARDAKPTVFTLTPHTDDQVDEWLKLTGHDKHARQPGLLKRGKSVLTSDGGAQRKEEELMSTITAEAEAAEGSHTKVVELPFGPWEVSRGSATMARMLLVVLIAPLVAASLICLAYVDNLLCETLHCSTPRPLHASNALHGDLIGEMHQAKYAVDSPSLHRALACRTHCHLPVIRYELAANLLWYSVFCWVAWVPLRDTAALAVFASRPSNMLPFKRLTIAIPPTLTLLSILGASHSVHGPDAYW